MPKLRALDTFSGIGGFSLALESVVKTVGYCDIEERSRAVLGKNMKSGLLGMAPIFDDIKAITAADLAKLKPDLLTAGFPCTDISSANPGGEGLKGLRSGLFKEVLRLIDAWDGFKYVLLENSPRIKNKGLVEVKRVMKKRGFALKYTFLEALDVGAHHKRKRWYCLCYKPELCSVRERESLVVKKSLMNSAWNMDFKGARVLGFKNKQGRDAMRDRCGLLGNAVVPHCVRAAWNQLLTQEKEYEAFRGAGVGDAARREPLGLEFSDGASVVKRRYWATPVHTTWHNYSHITGRGIGLLSNQCFYEIGTKVKAIGAKNSKMDLFRDYTCNPNFIEWLMGYPRDWTN